MGNMGKHGDWSNKKGDCKYHITGFNDTHEYVTFKSVSFSIGYLMLFGRYMRRWANLNQQTEWY